VTDEELMAQVVGGNMEALGVLFERHRQRLFAFLYRLLHDRTLAEDVLVDAFLRVFDRRRTYKAGSYFTT
jgi:RNA polymerase sigma-70 factor (ECF subfamily)